MTSQAELRMVSRLGHCHSAPGGVHISPFFPQWNSGVFFEQTSMKVSSLDMIPQEISRIGKWGVVTSRFWRSSWDYRFWIHRIHSHGRGSSTGEDGSTKTLWPQKKAPIQARKQTHHDLSNQPGDNDANLTQSWSLGKCSAVLECSVCHITVDQKTWSPPTVEQCGIDFPRRWFTDCSISTSVYNFTGGYIFFVIAKSTGDCLGIYNRPRTFIYRPKQWLQWLQWLGTVAWYHGACTWGFGQHRLGCGSRDEADPLIPLWFGWHREAQAGAFGKNCKRDEIIDFSGWSTRWPRKIYDLIGV